MERVLIVDSSQAFAGTLALALREFSHVYVRQQESVEALLQEVKPSAVVLDLTAPGIDGLAVLQHILQSDDPPAVLVTSVLTNHYVIDTLQRMRIAFVITRPCVTGLIANRIKDMMHYRTRMNAQKEVYKKHVYDVMTQLRIPMQMKGAKYAQAAIELYLMDPGAHFNGEIYPRIAAQYATDIKCVERCIRNAVQGTWKTCDQQVWSKYFPCDEQGRVIRPKNTVFISRIGQFILTLD